MQCIYVDLEATSQDANFISPPTVTEKSSICSRLILLRVSPLFATLGSVV